MSEVYGGLPRGLFYFILFTSIALVVTGILFPLVMSTSGVLLWQYVVASSLLALIGFALLMYIFCKVFRS